MLNIQNRESFLLNSNIIYYPRYSGKRSRHTCVRKRIVYYYLVFFNIYRNVYIIMYGEKKIKIRYCRVHNYCQHPLTSVNRIVLSITYYYNNYS